MSKRRNRVTHPSKEELEQLLSQYTLKETAELFGVHQNTVGGWKHALGITVKKGGTPIPTDFEEYCKNHTRKEVAEYYGINYEMVRIMEKRCNIKCAHRSCKTLEQQSDLAILLKYFSINEIAERFDVSPATIRVWAENNLQEMTYR